MERWKPIAGFEGAYEVSNLGRVRSLPRRINHYPGFTRMIPGKILKPSFGNHEYLVVSLSKHSKTRTFYVHRLVAQAFIPNPDNRPQVNHKRINEKSNNRVTNLEWVTSLENVTHAKANGRENKGEKNGAAKLTEAQVLEIRRLRRRGFLLRQLGVMFGIARETAGNVVRGRQWKWLHQ